MANANLTKTLYRAKAPLRVSFAGGGTDMAPYCDRYGGCALNATINKYAYTTLELLLDDRIEVYSMDYDYVAHFDVDDPLIYDGNIDLAKAVIKRLRRGQEGLRLTTRNDAPPGSGLGSSSAMVVSMVGAFREWLSLHLSDYETARLAFDIERKDLSLVGGMQDQYACAFGGFNYMEFKGDSVLVNPLRIKREIIWELEHNLLLYYTGKSRVSGHVIESQIRNVNSNRTESIEAMHMLVQQAVEMKNALLTGDTRGFGRLLHSAWEAKKKMADEISNTMIDEMYQEAIKAGALGGKVSGAGGGGFMLFYCENGRRHKVAERLEQLGGEVVDFQFEHDGLQSWRAAAADPD